MALFGILGLLLVAIVGVLQGTIGTSTVATREAVLKKDLSSMREAIDKFTLAQKRPPASLQELVDSGYIRRIPADPVTGKSDWVAHFAPLESSRQQVLAGIDDIHSNSPKRAGDGTRYDSW